MKTLADLFEMSIDEACAHRMRAGAEARGRAPGDPFQGDPRRELLEELIDAVNYARQSGDADIAAALKGIARLVLKRGPAVVLVLALLLFAPLSYAAPAKIISSGPDPICTIGDSLGRQVQLFGVGSPPGLCGRNEHGSIVKVTDGDTLGDDHGRSAKAAPAETQRRVRAPGLTLQSMAALHRAFPVKAADLRRADRARRQWRRRE